MRLSEGTIVVLLACAGVLHAQEAADPEVARAQATIDKLRPLVESGAAPRAQLEKAEDDLADTRDGAYLRKVLRIQDLSEEQTDGMVAAAERRFERRRKAYEEARKMVDAEIAPELSLGTLLVELDLARKECDLAESRARLTRQIAEMVRAEEAFEKQLSEATAPGPSSALADRFDGDGIFTAAIFSQVQAAFEARFGKPLPVSAMGETEVHRALGFDHRGRVDVAIHPDTTEGVWLRQYLTTNGIPFLAFRQAVPGKATGAHIHLGPMSTRLKVGG